MSVRDATPADAPAIAAIYDHYVAHTIVTFEEEPVSAEEMRRRMDEVASAGFPWLVAEIGGEVAGYAYATKWRERSGYRFSAEVTVYLAGRFGGQGLGSALYGALFPRLAERGIHAVLGGISLPNPASVALHEKFGMEKVAHLKDVGYKLDRWIDVGYWQRIL